jgi:hypothetical protein
VLPVFSLHMPFLASPRKHPQKPPAEEHEGYAVAVLREGTYFPACLPYGHRALGDVPCIPIRVLDA